MEQASSKTEGYNLSAEHRVHHRKRIQPTEHAAVLTEEKVSVTFLQGLVSK